MHQPPADIVVPKIDVRVLTLPVGGLNFVVAPFTLEALIFLCVVDPVVEIGGPDIFKSCCARVCSQDMALLRCF